MIVVENLDVEELTAVARRNREISKEYLPGSALNMYHTGYSNAVLDLIQTIKVANDS
jgi:hypothetical protein